jgi:histidine kinase 2/3/4 (cytokinin receptor)
MNAYKDEKTPVATGVSLNTSGFEAAETVGKASNFCFLMRKMKCPMMFTPFDAQTKVSTLFTQATGTEIALVISKCFVELMDGQINFVSQPHAESTFTFTTFFQRYDRSAIVKVSLLCCTIFHPGLI